MRMLSKFIAAATFSVVAIAPAYSEETGNQRFTHEGYTYVYKVKDTRTGQVISGRRYPDAVAFNLAVSNGKVKGQSNGQTVAFNVEEARGATE